ncbi:translation initiation factor IF-2-like [Mustela erminea]|uniref:translation initiation factor IF-2-like n=1 Tax=Mustela erminea TaxID=36723 RepID=UPI001386F8BD|nr:translation initiation factor IF-2-like [Mustela erminea]
MPPPHTHRGTRGTHTARRGRRVPLPDGPVKTEAWRSNHGPAGTWTVGGGHEPQATPPRRRLRPWPTRGELKPRRCRPVTAEAPAGLPGTATGPEGRHPTPPSPHPFPHPEPPRADRTPSPFPSTPELAFTHNRVSPRTRQPRPLSPQKTGGCRGKRGAQGVPPAPPHKSRNAGHTHGPTGLPGSPLPTAAQRPWRGAATAAPGVWWAAESGGEVNPPPHRPDPRRTGDPQRVFKPPQQDVLGTWTGGGGTGKAGGGHEATGHPRQDSDCVLGQAAGSGNPDAAGPCRGRPPPVPPGAATGPGGLHPTPPSPHPFPPPEPPGAHRTPLHSQTPQSSLLHTTASLPATANPGPSRHRRRGGCSGSGAPAGRAGEAMVESRGREGEEPNPGKRPVQGDRRGEIRSGEQQGQSRRPTDPERTIQGGSWEVAAGGRPA